jgi:hypothetical protein
VSFTFGTGVQGIEYDARCSPECFLRDVLVPDGSLSFPTTDEFSKYIITTIEASARGDGAGGPIGFQTSDSIQFWAVTFGAGLETYQWRGALVILGVEGTSVDVSSLTGGNHIDITICGLLVPNGLGS